MKCHPLSGKGAIRLVLLAVCSLLLVGCDDSPDAPCAGTVFPDRNNASVTIQQGIWGDLWFWEGDFMPVCPRGTVTAVQREVRVYEVTTPAMCDSFLGDGFFQGPHSRLIATANSDARGFFQVPLNAGRYSLCVVEGSLLYANFFGPQGEIGPIEILPDSVSSILFNINYRATF